MKEENPPKKEAPQEPAEPQPKPKPDEEAQTEDASTQAEEIAKKAAYVEADRLASLKKEVLEIETRLDEKVKAYKKFVEDTEVQGRSLAGPAVEQTAEEKLKAESNKFLEGTGMKI